MPKKGQKLQHYSLELKLEAIKMYLDGNNGGYKTLTKHYGLKSHKQLMEWVKKYQEGKSLEDFRGRSSKSDSPMVGRPKSRFNSIEEERDFYKAQVEYLKKRYPNLVAEVNLREKQDTKL